MSTTVTQPKTSPTSGNPTTHALVSLMQDPRQLRAWLGVTPNWLRAAMVAIVLLSAAFALAIRHAAVEQSPDHQDHPGGLLAQYRRRAGHTGKPGRHAQQPGQRTARIGQRRTDCRGGIYARGQDRAGKSPRARRPGQRTAGRAGQSQAGVDLQDSAPTIFRKRRAEAARYLLAAAMNITYPGEVGAVRTVI